MSYVIIATPPFKTVEEFDALMSNVQDPPAGMQARYVGSCDGQVRIISVWDSQEHADAFYAEQLAPALAKTFGAETRLPDVLRIPVARDFTRELVG